MAQSRIKWVDICKGIGIFLVILGHYMQTLHLNYGGTYSDIFYWIYSFHMPLFFFLSGTVYKKYEINVFFKKKIRSLLCPIIFFSVLYTLYKVFIIKEKINLVDALVCRSDSYIHFYWFIWTLLWTEILFYILDSIITNNSYICIISILIMAFCLLKNYQNILLHIPFCIGNVVFVFPFYCLGVRIKNINNLKQLKCLPVAIVIDFLLCKFYKYGTSYALLSFGIWVLDYIKAVIGIIIFISFSKIIANERIKWLSNILQKIGRESLWLYLIHGFFFWGMFKKGIQFLPQNTMLIIVYALGSTSLTIAIIYFGVVISKKVYRRYVNVLQFEKQN